MELSLEISDDLLESVQSSGASLVKRVPSLLPQQCVREIIPLAEEDLQILALQGPEHCLPALKHIRSIHHMVALRLAVGERPTKISASLSISPGSISRLLGDAQFTELVASYREQVVDRELDVAGVMSAVAQQSLLVLLDRLGGDEADEISTDVVRRIAEGFADRIGHSPVRRSETVARHSLSLSTEIIDRIKQVHGEDNVYSGGNSHIDVEILPSSPPGEEPPASLAGLITASGEAETERNSAPRDLVPEQSREDAPS